MGLCKPAGAVGWSLLLFLPCPWSAGQLWPAAVAPLPTAEVVCLDLLCFPVTLLLLFCAVAVLRSVTGTTFKALLSSHFSLAYCLEVLVYKQVLMPFLQRGGFFLESFSCIWNYCYSGAIFAIFFCPLLNSAIGRGSKFFHVWTSIPYSTGTYTTNHRELHLGSWGIWWHAVVQIISGYQ